MLYTQLRAFDAVARAGSFTKASALLGLSQPAVSAQIRALEVAYGIQLFHRRGHTIRLTRAGRELVPLCRSVISGEEQVQRYLNDKREDGSGTLRIAFDGPHITIPILAQYHRKHPRVSLVVSMGNTRLVRQSLLDRQVDLAVLPRAMEDPRFHSVPIKQHEPAVIVGKGSRWFGQRSIAMRDLVGEPMIAREVGSNTQRCIDEGFGGSGLVPNIVLRLGSREAVKEAVAANLGYAIVWQSEAHSDTRLHSMRLTDSSIRSIDFLACLKDERHRREILGFFKLAAQQKI